MGSCPSKSWFWGSTFTHNWLIFCNAQLHLATSAPYLHRSHNYLAITHMCSRLLVRVPSTSVSLSFSLGNYCCLSVLIKMCVCLAGLESFQCQQIICVCHKCRPHRLKLPSTAQFVVALCYEISKFHFICLHCEQTKY